MRFRTLVRCVGSAQYSVMFRPGTAVVATMIICAACGSAGEIEPQAGLTGSITTVSGPRVDKATTSVAPTTTFAATTTLAPTTTEVATTVAPTEPLEQTIYHPEPIWEGKQVTAMIQPVEGVVLDNSSVAMWIAQLPDGRFLEADLTNAVVPEGAAFWAIDINGRLRSKTTAYQGSTKGIRVDRDVYGDSFTVTLSATTADGAVLATTGDVQMTE